MRVGIEAMQLWGEWTGVGRAIWEVARRLSAEPRGHEYVLYTSRGFKRKGDLAAEHFRVRRTWFSARNRTLRVFWQQLRLPSLASRQTDVLHAPAYVMPLMARVPVVVTVHDTIALRHPELVRRSSASHLKRFLPKTLDRAELVLTPSHAVAADLLTLFGEMERDSVSPTRSGTRSDGGLRSRSPLAEKIRVIPFGVGPEFEPLSCRANDATADAGVTARADARRSLGILGLDKPYVLFVSRIEPKKNVERVVEAFFAAAMVKRLPHDLVLVGPAKRTKKLDRLIRDLNIVERVKRPGYVPDEVLPALYAGADLLLLPSKVEGFGFPVLEAMASGTPCVISRDPALAELAGDAALQVEWDRLDLLREAVERALTDRKLARRLRQGGLERAKRFTWEKTVDLTVAAYEEARALFERRLHG